MIPAIPGIARNLAMGGHASNYLPSFPATGRTVRMSGATVYDFDEGGRICGQWQVTDRLGVYQQLRDKG